MSRAIMQQALDLLKSAYVGIDLVWKRNECVDAIEQELAKPEQDLPTLRQVVIESALKGYGKPEQEPVAWVSESESTKQFVEGRPRRVWWECNTGVGKPFYIAPPRKKWVGLTDEELIEFKGQWVCGEFESFFDFFNAIEAKLKEKNA